MSTAARLLPLLVVLGGSSIAPLAALPDELWVLNEKTRTISIVDTPTETVVATITLPGGAAGAGPGDLCAATLPGHQGAFAFVLQGDQLLVYATATRSLSTTLDVAALLGRPVRLAGCDAGPTEEFDAPGLVVRRTHLFVSAGVRIPGTATDEPAFLVFDQQRLIVPIALPALVGQGPLVDSSVPPAERGAPFGVTALGSRWGEDQRQRAWFSVVTGGATPRQLYVLVAKASGDAEPWRRVREVASPMPAGAKPAAVRAGAPHDRNLTVAAQPGSGRLANLDTDRGCAIGGRPSVVMMAGPAPGALRTWALDIEANALVRVHESTCASDTFTTGRHPVAMARGGHGPFGKVFVANHGDDSVTVVRPDDSTDVVPLATPPGPECALCPVALAEMSLPHARGCTIAGLAVATADTNFDGTLDDVLGWTPIGCPEIQFAVYCQCVNASLGDPSCPCWCDPGVDPTCLQSLPPPQFSRQADTSGLHFLPANPWKPMGIVATPGFTLLSAGPWDLAYTVTPETP